MSCFASNILRLVRKAAFALVMLPLAANALQPVYLVEPDFMRPEIKRPLPGAKRTVIALGLIDNGEVRYLSRAEIPRLSMNQGRFEQLSLAYAKQVREKLKPAYVRSSDGIIQYAVLDSDDPPAVLAILDPDFGRQFADTLGDELILAVPRRGRVYVFPKHASFWDRLGMLVVDEFRDAPEPVSREVFEWSPSGLRVVGEFRP